MPAARWVGFGLVWAALVLFSVDSLRAARRGAAVGAGDVAQSPSLSSTVR